MTDNKPATGKPWTDTENDATAAAYLDMLARELRGDKYNKAATRRALIDGTGNAKGAKLGPLAVRSHGSVEMKNCNVSAVMRAAGLPWINGYKPLGHGQQKPLAAALVRQMIAHGWNDDDIAALEKVTT